METTRVVYDDGIVRRFIAASMIFGIIGMTLGALIALQLAYWPANVSPELAFGRLRPLHTNAVIFAFVGNMIFAGVYYSTQRLCKARMASDLLSKIHFWGWQAIILAAVITLPLGLSQGKEYAELIWPIDIAITVIWVVFGANFFLTLRNRREKHLYVGLWFYIATLVSIAVLHIVNSLQLPVSLTHSYPIFAGVQDALVQWWYGHNAVAFFLTTPILGIMYYFVPKAAERPIFSYRLSIIHFWGLIFIYMWAGPHHLLYTALPDWAQSLGMVFSLMLWAPSWGGMLNGLLTFRGAWDRLRADPVLKFFAAGITFYGMATFEGPLLSIKSVSAIAHYTDWIVAHVHAGALGWNGFMAAGMFYWLVPRLFGTELRSRSAANFHFWIGTFGIVLYTTSLWTAGIQQGLMWQAQSPDGGLLYPNFLETIEAIRPMWWMRLIGGTLYLLGFVLMAWNLTATALKGKAIDGSVEVPVEPPCFEKEPRDARGLVSTLLSGPVVLVICVMLLIGSVAFLDTMAATLFMGLGLAVMLVGLGILRLARPANDRGFHHNIEGRAAPFTILTIFAVVIGGIAEILPTVVAAPEMTQSTHNVPYTGLELEGRDVFVKEGCYNCHSQMIRPFTWETARYGAVSQAHESVYDRPFQWGSRRIGPDLARVGGKYSDTWQYRHLVDPRNISPGSNMPPYDHLAYQPVDFDGTPPKLRAMRAAGVPYTPEQILTSTEDARARAMEVAVGLRDEAGVRLCEEGQGKGECDLRTDSEMIALVAYLQRLGRVPTTESPSPAVASATGD